jgi:uncharacterized protein YciI
MRSVAILFVTLFVPALVADSRERAGITANQLPPGFEQYLLGFLHRGTGEVPAGETAESLQKAHLANLNRMWEEGLLLASGPIADKGDLRGVLIFRHDRAAVDKRVAEDALVKSGRLRLTLKPWMGPTGVGADYKKWAAENPGAPDKMRTYQLVLLRPAPLATPLTPPEQMAHLKHMDTMVKSGHLIVAGPVLEPGDLAGIFVFDTDAAQADKLVAADPAVVSKKMVVERVPWMMAEQVLPKGFKVPLP